MSKDVAPLAAPVASEPAPRIGISRPPPVPTVAPVAPVLPLGPGPRGGGGAGDADDPMDVDVNYPEVLASHGAGMSIDVVILMDCTGSMDPWIHAAKTTSVATASDLKKAMPGAEYRLGFVGYRDFGDAEQYITAPLTYRPEQIEERLQSVKAAGGGDTAEDVAGGLRHVLDMEWTARTKVVIHVADAPAHGRKFHDILLSDRYPKGDPSGSDPVQLMKDLSKRGIDYYFIKIKDDTDSMIKLFEAAYEEAKASDEQTFMLLDLKVQGAPGPAPVPSRDPVPMPYPVMPHPVMPGGPTKPLFDDALGGARRLEAEEAPERERSAGFAPTMAMAPMAAARASADMLSAAYGEACTTSVMRSVAKRVTASKPGK